MLKFKYEFAEELLRDVIRDSERFARFQMSKRRTPDPIVDPMALSMWMKACDLGITSMLNDQVQHYAYQYLISLDANDDALDYWGIDPDNRSECFPYYQAAA